VKKCRGCANHRGTPIRCPVRQMQREGEVPEEAWNGVINRGRVTYLTRRGGTPWLMTSKA
jgi:hypothetical protein